MDQETWRSQETGEGFKSVVAKYTHAPHEAIRRLKLEWPWHSKIRLPFEANYNQEEDFYHLESHDLDCLIIVVRTSLALGFWPSSSPSTILKCAEHNFGIDKRSDYEAKGMLVSKLFPDDLGDVQALRSKLTFESLLKHPGIDKIIFASEAFALKSRHIFISDRPAEVLDLRGMKEGPSEIMTHEHEIKWNGIKTLEQAVGEQSYDFDPEAENGTKTSERFCLVPQFIRVKFTPHKDHLRRFDDVRMFQLKVPTLRQEDGMIKKHMSDSTYRLYAVVKLDPQSPMKNPAEVRVYDTAARMMLPNAINKYGQGPVIRQDTQWSVGDPSFEFMLFYHKSYSDEEQRANLQDVPYAAEYRTPYAEAGFGAVPPPTPEHQSDPTDSVESETFPLQASRRQTPARISQSNDDEDVDTIIDAILVEITTMGVSLAAEIIILGMMASGITRVIPTNIITVSATASEMVSIIGTALTVVDIVLPTMDHETADMEEESDRPEGLMDAQIERRRRREETEGTGDEMK
ncbi:hypothetical protein F4678DRAFT_465041 [Xylaria arbuscula]|nr:hypothetical protein F4678DRAFT_465041 [Xylaria arbuscula]